MASTTFLSLRSSLAINEILNLGVLAIYRSACSRRASSMLTDVNNEQLAAIFGVKDRLKQRT